MLKVLIADDDYGMRKVLKKVLSKREEFEVIAECENGLVALDIFEEKKPDVIFLDIEMPEMNGIECARRIFDINPKVMIVFATAHEGFMSQAFEVYAFDYLLKPFDLQRLESTLDRINDASYDNKQASNVKTQSISNKANKLIIKNKDGMSFLNCDDIVMVQREERSTVVYTSKDKHITSESLSNVEEKLDNTLFMRSHKSYVINTSKITNIYPYGRWTYIVKFEGCKFDALITHKKYEELESLFII